MRPLLLVAFLCTTVPTLAQQPDTLAPRRVAVELPSTDSLASRVPSEIHKRFICFNPTISTTHTTSTIVFLSIQEQLRQVAGMQVTPYSGAPGAQMVMRIRGVASFTDDAQPLYVVDGVPVFQRTFRSGARSSVYLDALPEIQELDTNPLLHIPTEDIEQVEVLKGAFETAQYGSQGINGVIRITTRQGHTGAPRVQYIGYGGVQQARYCYELLGARQYAVLANEAARNDGQPPRFSLAEVAALDRGTDWQAEMLRTAAIQEHHLSLSGGTAATHYYTGVDYLGQQGIVLNSNLRRYAVRANVDQQIGQRLHVAVRGSLSETQRRVPSYYALQNALYEQPTRTVQDTTNQRYLVNPVQEAREWYQTPRQQRLLAQLNAQYRLATGLTLELLGGLERATQRSESYRSAFASYPAGQNADLASTYRQWVINPALRYVRSFEDGRHAITASVEAIRQRQSLTNRKESYIPGTPVLSIEDEWEKIGVDFYQLTGGYTFAERYQVQGSLRRDISAAFASVDRSQWLPGVQAIWHADKEGFLRKNQLVSKLNTWVGVGYTSGAGNLGRNLYTLPMPVFGGSPFLPLRERSRQLDAGLALGMWQNRLNLTIQGYTRRTVDEKSSFREWPGMLHNNGVELTVNGQWQLGPVQGSTTLAAAANRNRYQLKSPDDDNPYDRTVHNRPLSTFYGLHYLGVDAVGRPRFVGSNSNSQSRPEDFQPLGNGLPRQLLTLTQQLTYKRLTLDVQADAMWGYQVQNRQLNVLDVPSGRDNATTRVLDRWTPTNTTTNVPQANQQLQISSFNDYTLQSGNHVRLTAATLSYPVWQRAARSASVWVGGQNLLVLTRYRGYDPNVSSFGSDGTQAGFDIGAYPTARTFLLGVRATL
ncbi:TonB-dependent receptor plug domain-containing protein [Hymenobacter sp. NBH84]|uniref:TonB-dependent receptor plug domain-containing protein n=1 Tax=Hymenobacter sp. NBH84 TaxID=2596915 RepID=UPI0016259482|nr:TonB-dependent receptor plug domain-containing protein [Hymenobacter sp. NBH84]QNE41106.1 TonB-dependent receptor plug domain-containing protein [Hymenobacter sp. NBH84]